MHLICELAKDPHGRPFSLPVGLAVAVLPRHKVEGRHILVAVIDVIHAMRSGHHMLGAD